MKPPIRLGRLAFLAVLPLMASTHPAAAENGGLHCEKPVGIEGPPHLITTIASMNAIRVWIAMVEKKYGPDYSMWHNAGIKSIKCASVKHSKALKCFARARPCKARVAKTASGKARTASN